MNFCNSVVWLLSKKTIADKGGFKVKFFEPSWDNTNICSSSKKWSFER
jgi:hypothetical protein